MADMDESGRGRLGRLFAALVSTDPDDGAEAAGGTDGNTSVLDVDGLADALMASPDPMALLAGMVADVRARAEATALPGADVPALPPSALETHLAARLVGAGLLEPEPELPSVRVVRPRLSGLLYLRIEDERVSYLAKLRVLGIEAALNSALLVTRALERPADATVEELVRAEQRVARSIVAQAGEVAGRVGAPALGEWEVRHAISLGIESLRLPYRLTTRFRVNVARGVAAFEVDLVPPSAWVDTAFVDGLGIVPATAEMRRRAASDYNARLALLLAELALDACPQLSEVWVAGVVDTATDHACYYSVRIGRALLERLGPDPAASPLAALGAAGAEIDADGVSLHPVRQGFTLDDEELCPPQRYEPPELSDRVLFGDRPRALGCERVLDLGVDEAARRRAVARELTRDLGTSTADNVAAILEAARRDGSPDVDEAAHRCLRGLIDGTLDDDPLAIEEAFVAGDDLTRLCALARGRLAARDLDGAGRLAEEALLPVDGLGTYEGGSDGTRWASFDGYADRVVYNRLVARPGERCALVPSAYLEAHTVAAACDLARGRVESALAHARRAAQVAPLSAQAGLNLAQCLEAAGDAEGAEGEIARVLSLAHDPESIGIAYLQMAQLQWQAGRVLAAQACYQRATRQLGAPALVAGLAVVALIGHVGASSGGQLGPEQADSVLVAAGIPLAPTEEVGAVLLEAARAATDAELFCVARDLTRALCSLTRDDVTYGILRSFEDEPDR
ncbi:tetratricopeptide repeat protein [Thermophilibacter mediterraneus]|uniref:tetratricopeptide repeat protein n=1 Tax=Thermophilibacter mediterraneus TaxID=1871031 RepID=UPI0032081E89